MRMVDAIFIGAATLAFVSISSPAWADLKENFAKGCREGGGSYGEDVDGVFCNTSGGVHIRCDEKITKCTASSATRAAEPIKPTRSAVQKYLKANRAPSAGVSSAASKVTPPK